MIVFDVKTYLGEVFAAPSSSSGEEMMLPALCHQTTAPLLHFFCKSMSEKKKRESTDSYSRHPKRNASPTLCSAAHAALFQAAWLTAGLAC